ncbi:MAG: hypothetical protein R3C97_14705 [Geminicoccaceae bacterium]
MSTDVSVDGAGAGSDSSPIWQLHAEEAGGQLAVAAAKKAQGGFRMEVAGTGGGPELFERTIEFVGQLLADSMVVRVLQREQGTLRLADGGEIDGIQIRGV